MAHITKLGPGRYKARFRKPNGREGSKTFPRRADAKNWLTSQEGSKLAGTWVDPALGRMTFADYVDRWTPTTVHLRTSSRDLNLGVVRNYLIPRFAEWPLAAIGVDDVKAMIADELAVPEGDRLSNSAIRRHAIVLGVILQAALDDGRIARNPVRSSSVTLPPENARDMRFLEPEEIWTLVEAAPEYYQPLVLTAAYSGLRWGELSGLAADRLDLLRRTIRVERTLHERPTLGFGPPKTKAARRTVTIPAALTVILGPHLGSAPVRSSGLAFPGPKGAALRRGNFNRIWRKTCVRAGFDPTREDTDDPLRSPGPLEGLVFHELRHTAAALAIAEGAHPLAIKERLGHSSITVTMDRYGGLFPRLEEAIAEGLDRTFRDSLASNSRPEAAKL